MRVLEAGEGLLVSHGLWPPLTGSLSWEKWELTWRKGTNGSASQPLRNSLSPGRGQAPGADILELGLEDPWLAECSGCTVVFPTKATASWTDFVAGKGSFQQGVGSITVKRMPSTATLCLGEGLPKLSWLFLVLSPVGMWEQGHPSLGVRRTIRGVMGLEASIGKYWYSDSRVCGVNNYFVAETVVCWPNNPSLEDPTSHDRDLKCQVLTVLTGLVCGPV